jgi:hypothetical protein
MHTIFHRTNGLVRSQLSIHRPGSTAVAAQICLPLVTIAIAIVAMGAGPALAARQSVSAHAASPAAITCDDVLGPTWTIPGSGEPTGDSYVVIAQNIPCSRAVGVAVVFANRILGPRLGWKCTYHKHFNGDCKRTLRRRRHRPIVQVVGWYPDFAHPNGP